ncbi:hypothetical protein QVD17_03473 [Tagetes erecta]|uniref:Uncharacterized protein n=1 Tax=Tagetes erecta TaxID=13708 RepID=A0AAD8LA07_TARER|nr:hypothetical protein QVD17_03473 [Tagetes erecta]
MPQDLSYELAKLRLCKTRKTHDSNPTTVQFLFIWVILMATHLPPSSADHRRHDPPPSAQKAVFFKPESLYFHPAARSRSPGKNDLYDEDKRMVHTGPNPLHN